MPKRVRGIIKWNLVQSGRIIIIQERNDVNGYK